MNDSPTLSKHLWVRRQIKVIEANPQSSFSGSFFKVLSGGKVAKSGHNASLTLWDELGEIQNDEAWQRLYASGKNRKQPVWFCISTPQYDRYSLAWSEFSKAKQVLSGDSLDTEYLAVIHGVPDDVDYKNPDNWWQHLAGLGDCVDKAYYLADWETAKDNPRDLARFRNHLLCQWTESLSQWLPIEKIRSCMVTFDESDLYKKRCYIGIDGGIQALAAYCLYFPETGHVITRFFHPKDNAEAYDRKLGTKYQAYAQDNYVSLTPGNLFDWATVKSSLLADCKRFDVAEIAFDPQSLEGRLAELQADAPCLVVPISPYVNHMGEPTKLLERMVLSGELKIQANPLMESNLTNAAIKIDTYDKIRMDRDLSSGRYDGAYALALCLNRHLAHPNNGDADVILL